MYVLHMKRECLRNLFESSITLASNCLFAALLILFSNACLHRQFLASTRQLSIRRAIDSKKRDKLIDNVFLI